MGWRCPPAAAVCPQIIVTDLTGDWMPDQVGIRDGRLYVLEQTPAGFRDVTESWVPESPTGVRCLLAGQFNADELLDVAAVVVESAKQVVLLNPGRSGGPWILQSSP